MGSSSLTPRLPLLEPTGLTPDQRSVYDAIVGGERGRVPGFEMTDSEGRLNEPFGVMLHAPSLGGPLQELGAAVRFRSHLTRRCLEIATLIAARSAHSDYEWWAHEGLARRAGFSEGELEGLARGTFVSTDREEQATADLCYALDRGATLPAEDYQAARESLTAEQMVEVTTVMAYYRSLALLMKAFDVQPPADARHWLERVRTETDTADPERSGQKAEA